MVAPSAEAGGNAPRPRSRFQRRPGPNADPRTRRDEAFAFGEADAAEAPPWRPPAWFDRVAVALFETNDAVNVGSVVRAMANTGFSHLRLVNPTTGARPDTWDVIGIAHYTQHIYDHATLYPDLPSALADATLVIGLSGKHHREKRNAVSLPPALAAAVEHARATPDARVAFLFGREDSGLPNDALDHCHLVATIPTNPAYPSLNLAQAVLLVLYGLFQAAGGEEQAVRPPRRRAPPASAALMEHLFADLDRALDAVEFFKSRSRASIMRSLRALLYRAAPDQREASLLRAAAIETRRYLHRRGLLSSVGPIGVHVAGGTDGEASERSHHNRS